MTKKHSHRIDAVRGLAILLVLSFHTLSCIYPGYQAQTYSANGVLIIANLKSLLLNFNPVGQGWIGVELFLVISGFLIHFIYLQNQSGFKWRPFFSKRFWRIYPPYVLVLLFFFFSRPDINPTGLVDFFSHFFLIHNLSDKTFFTINPSFWSIALEVQLYLLYPIYLILTKYFTAPKTILLLLLTLIVLRLFAYFYDIEYLSFNASVFNFWFTWAMGAFLAERYYLNNKLFKKPYIWFIFFYTSFFVFKLFDFTNHFILIPASLCCVSFVEAILYSNLIGKYLVNRGIVKYLSYVGLISYSLYLIHQPYLNDLLNFYNPKTNNILINNFIRVAFTYITLFAISYSLYIFIEQRSIAYGKEIRKN